MCISYHSVLRLSWKRRNNGIRRSWEEGSWCERCTGSLLEKKWKSKTRKWRRTWGATRWTLTGRHLRMELLNCNEHVTFRSLRARHYHDYQRGDCILIFLSVTLVRNSTLKQFFMPDQVLSCEEPFKFKWFKNLQNRQQRYLKGICGSCFRSRKIGSQTPIT